MIFLKMRRGNLCQIKQIAPILIFIIMTQNLMILVPNFSIGALVGDRTNINTYCQRLLGRFLVG